MGHDGPGGRAGILTVVGRGNNINGSAATVGLSTTLNRRRGGYLMVSFSPRKGAADNCKVSGSRLRRSVCSTLLRNCSVDRLVIRAPRPHMFIIPTAVRLTNTRVRLMDGVTHRDVLGGLVSRIGSRFSCIFVSYPPSLNLLAVGTLSTTGNLLVPVRYRCCTLRNIAGLLRSVGLIGSDLGPSLSIFNMLVAVCSGHAALSGSIITRIGGCFNGGVFGAIVPEDMGVSRTPDRKLPVTVCSTAGGNTVTCHKLTERIVHHNWRRQA